MIRNTVKEDACKIKELLKREIGEFDVEELEGILKNSSSSLVYENNGQVVGAAVVYIYNKNLRKAQMLIYVSESYRKMGIGKDLYLKSLDYCNKEKVTNVIIDIRTEKHDSSEFFTSRGFKKWYGGVEMEYNGGTVESNLQLVNYDSKYYEKYKNVYEDCFAEMREAVGFSPVRCCDQPEELMETKDTRFLLLDNEEIIGSVFLNDNEIDDVIVNEKHQGKGYGRKLLRFAINEYQKNGDKKIFLIVNDWNKKALKLYESEGFVSTKKVEVYRKALNN